MRGSHSQRQMRLMALKLTVAIFIAVFALLILPLASAHPEDEFCTPGNDSVDPELCAALAELDRKDGELQLYPVEVDRGAIETAALYLSIGVRHILPGGLDHILFVLAIFLASVRWQALLLQVSAFTVAHTVTLALAASGIITPSPGIVEPLIAFTIGFVAVENLVFREMTRWRPAVVFGFGLIHGLGFAGFFGDLGLPPGQFWSALIGFNLGVEVGQLLVLAVAIGLGVSLRRFFNDTNGTRQYRRFVVLPGSAIIGLVGFWWAVNRLIP
ncbi:MAG TPA: HupE/UreJ family protein [Woeseiaceae bacterium]|nr:HupE/UreJ family protein [Woeseiaceae bacterium]